MNLKKLIRSEIADTVKSEAKRFGRIFRRRWREVRREKREESK